jgi:hypothetical protein
VSDPSKSLLSDPAAIESDDEPLVDAETIDTHNMVPPTPPTATATSTSTVAPVVSTATTSSSSSSSSSSFSSSSSSSFSSSSSSSLVVSEKSETVSSAAKETYDKELKLAEEVLFVEWEAALARYLHLNMYLYIYELDINYFIRSLLLPLKCISLLHTF